MVLETNVRDVAMSNAIIFVDFTSVPFAYQFEALAVSSIFAVIVNNVFLLLALLRTAGDRRVLSQASRRERRRPATPD